MRGAIEFQWSPRPSDWRDALRAAVPLYRWAPWFAGALAACSVLLLVLGDVAAGCYGLVAAAVVAALVPLAAHRSFRAAPLAGRTVTGHADDQAIRLTIGDEARSVVRWSALPAWSETSRNIVLRTGPGAASPVYAVPHRAFADPADARRFRELLARHIGPAGR
ncbi:YcxB family protein [Gandjariella thermophila]|uniref:YcxB-like C-terminal domain-containing protein n=1 Tax=Gandjariella thermophila TaxID=1931992 RepID=A0A4D4J3P1_9PSEU|nr:YcxB family protein [Gandjariella thermophila]GDY28607.1 hypothetical protein GTS_02400 [Gandjariella thermophila]